MMIVSRMIVVVTWLDNSNSDEKIISITEKTTKPACFFVSKNAYSL